MRLLKAKDFIKVIKGEDIEFRISPYEICVKEPLVIEGIKSIYSLSFPKVKFKSLTIRNCNFSGTLKFNQLVGKNFCFEKSTIEGLTILDSRIEQITVKSNERVGALYFDRTSTNKLSIVKNKNFESLHLGCANNVLKANLSRNGMLNNLQSKSSAYICPEQFGEIDIVGLKAASVEIGTFGEHSRLTVNGITTDSFKIKNCNATKSQVSLKNIRPMSSEMSQLTIEDSILDESVMQKSEMKLFKGLSIENSEVGDLKRVVAELKNLRKAGFWKRSISSLFLW